MQLHASVHGMLYMVYVGLMSVVISCYMNNLHVSADKSDRWYQAEPYMDMVCRPDTTTLGHTTVYRNQALDNT
jgi:hypothetical protein